MISTTETAAPDLQLNNTGRYFERQPSGQETQASSKQKKKIPLLLSFFLSFLFRFYIDGH